MRGDTEHQANIMLAVTPDDFVPADHPIRRIKPIVDWALCSAICVSDRQSRWPLSDALAVDTAVLSCIAHWRRNVPQLLTWMLTTPTVQ